MTKAIPLAMSLVLGACSAEAQWWDPGDTPGSVVAVSVEVAGQRTPLYRAPDGANRFYLEARAGCPYAIGLANRTGERVGVVLTVDGLNAISGELDAGRGRMYILGPWEQLTVRGWRTSLSDIRKFTFVDERASYAARSGKANGRMGWIEATVYRERRVAVVRPWSEVGPRGDEGHRDDSAGAMPAPAAPSEGAAAQKLETPPTAEAAPKDSARAYGESRSFPGTGWGDRAEDRAVVVQFDPESAAADRVSLRYEYRSALVALGVLPRPWPPRDRLRERERGEGGFAKPPAW
jgi:hypothetical protein